MYNHDKDLCAAIPNITLFRLHVNQQLFLLFFPRKRSLNYFLYLLQLLIKYVLPPDKIVISRHPLYTSRKTLKFSYGFYF